MQDIFLNLISLLLLVISIKIAKTNTSFLKMQYNY